MTARDRLSERFHGTTFHVDPAWRDLLAAAGITAFRHIYKFRPMGEGREGRSVVRVQAVTPNGIRWLYLKVYRYRGWRLLRTFLYRAKAEREFANLLAVAEAGVPAVRPAAWGVRRWMGFIPTSVLITEAFEGAQNGRVLVTAYVTGEPATIPREAFSPVLDRAVEGMRALHDRGIFLHTAFDKNLLIRMNGGSAEYRWVDLPFAGRVPPGRLRERRRVRDLACLQKGLGQVLSAPARLRLLRRYLGPEAEPGRLKRLAARVLRRMRALRDETLVTGAVKRVKRWV